MSYEELSKIAETEFPDIVIGSRAERGKLRIFIIDGSFIDVWFSRRLEGRFAYHWERREMDGEVYRYDNRPHEKLKDMRGFPRHFHNGSDEAVKGSEFSEESREAMREFLQFIRDYLQIREEK